MVSSVDKEETQKFALLENDWWDLSGPLQTLHKINPSRLSFIQNTSELKGKRILDVGCGGGILSEALSREGAEVTGIDAESTAIEVARNHALQQGLDIRYACMPIEDCSFEPFDIITCMELLEHVPNPALILEKAATLLKPGGKFYISTINRSAKAYFFAILAAEYVFRLLPRQTHDYQKFLKPSEIAAVCKIQGLELLQLKGMAYNPLTGHASLVDDVSVNYLMEWSKRA